MAINTPFSLPSGVFKRGNSLFDPNFGLGHVPNNKGPSTEAILSEADKLLHKYGYSGLVKSDFEGSHDYISSEVGDDEQTVSNSKPFIALQLVNHQLYGMKVSWSDTSINSRFGNFAEDVIVLPDGYGQTYLRARKSNSFNSMSYMDIPKLRLAIDIRPMRMDHSATNDGKASMIGARQQWIPLESPWRATYEVFNLFQDINLGLHRDKKFPYLPSSLGGYGKEPPFRNYMNFERFMKAFKQGSHSELIRNIVNRTIDYLSKRQNNEYPAKDPLLSHIVRFQSSFHDWVKGRSIYAPVTWLDVPPEVAKYQIAKFGESSVKDEVIGRLLSEKVLISEQQLEIAVEHNELCKALLQSTALPEFKRIRDEAKMRWNSFSVFSLENYGMIKELSLDQSFSRKILRPIDVAYFFKLVTEFRYNLRHIIGEEFVYGQEAMDEIYKTGPMKVKFSMSPINKIGTRAFAAQRSEYKSDMIDTEEPYDEELDNLLDWLRKGGVGRPSTIILNDDCVIEEDCKTSFFNVIITDDIALCKRASRNAIVFRLPVEYYYLALYFGVGKDTEDLIREKFPEISEFKVHMDSGSIKAFEENRFYNGSMLRTSFIQKFSFWKPMGKKDPIIIEELDDFSEYPLDMDRLLFDQKNILRRRKNRRVIPVAKSLNSSSSWRK